MSTTNRHPSSPLRTSTNDPIRVDSVKAAPTAITAQPQPGLDRVRACLLAGALGDALGNPIEFMGAADIVSQYGTASPSRLNFAGGALAHITDDTQMTLFTAEGIGRALEANRDADNQAVLDEIKLAYLRWLMTQGYQVAVPVGDTGGLLTEKRLHARRAPGNTCLSAVHTLANDAAARHTAESPANNSKGCGAVMRIAPIGLAAASREQAFRLALEAGALTHGHPSGFLSGAYCAAVLWDIARGEAIETALVHADALLAKEPGADEMITILARMRKLASAVTSQGRAPTIEEVESLGGGWVGEEALAIALLCVLTRQGDDPASVKAALWCAACHTGDSDSTGAIAGNLLGALLGDACLPGDWLEQLELREVIEAAARRLLALAIAS